MRRKFIPVLILFLVCVLALTACSGNTRFASLDELSKNVQFTVLNPTVVPDGYTAAGYFAQGSNIAEIVYVNGDKQLIFVMTTSKKVESDIGTFEQTKNVQAGGVPFTMSLSGGLVHLAVAQVGVYNYAIYSKTGITEADAMSMAAGLNLGGKAQ
jgi:hypothetical protein